MLLESRRLFAVMSEDSRTLNLFNPPPVVFLRLGTAVDKRVLVNTKPMGYFCLCRLYINQYSLNTCQFLLVQLLFALHKHEAYVQGGSGD